MPLLGDDHGRPARHLRYYWRGPGQPQPKVGARKPSADLHQASSARGSGGRSLRSICKKSILAPPILTKLSLMARLTTIVVRSALISPFRISSASALIFS